MTFISRYAKLNAAQKQAVDTIEGPVMVIAGPGTGKTELLSMRAANILQKTDTLPESILCLTFTDSGANAMRNRLTDIIGKDAYKVAIHTFHSFGSEVMNQYAEYFYNGANYRAADELSSYEIIRTIFDELEYSNPLAGKNNGEYTHLADTLKTISELKKSGLTSDELLLVLDDNDATLDALEPGIQAALTPRVSSKTIDSLVPLAHTAAELPVRTLPSGVTSLSSVLALSLAHTVDEAQATSSTKSVTAWKKRWLEKDEAGNLVFKARKQQLKLRSVSYIYFQYLSRMQEASLYDFDDMILRVVHAIEVFPELRFNLQERYQYIMVDEFQDTNLAQMRILHNLTNNAVQGDTPNILIVGDDDQAIYSFQGADISNILNFQTTYTKAQRIALTDNYRSTDVVLKRARNVILQGVDRLENHYDDLSKQLVAHYSAPDTNVSLHSAATVSEEAQWLVTEVQSQLQAGVPAEELTVLTRRHYEILRLLPYFAEAGIPVNYERRDNVLELEPIILIEKLATIVLALSNNRHSDVNALLPELLAHPAWDFVPLDLWKLSTTAYDQRKRWMDIMPTMTQFSALHQWLITLASNAAWQPLEHLLDTMLGTPTNHTPDSIVDDDEAQQSEASGTATVYQSPLYSYFFGADTLTAHPETFIIYLEALRTIRTKLREYRPNDQSTLSAFIEFIHLHRQLGSTISSIHTPAEARSGAINLMTAHKAKGLEFDTVFIPGAVDTTWGERARSRSRLISYPENLPLATAGETADERLRLFYVAATRAKRQLYISYATRDESGKELAPASFLVNDTWINDEIPLLTTASDLVAAAERRWYEHVSTPSPELKSLLVPTLERYKLSATHLNNFLDVTRGGPRTFLLHNLLRFPQAMGPAAAYGSAIHAALQRAHAHLAATKKQRAVEDILHDFEVALGEQRLEAKEFDTYLQKGTDTLQAFLAEKYSSFTPTQKVELAFAGQQALVGEAHLTGALDLVDIDEPTKTIVVTDYKTGHPAGSWTGKTDYEKIKLHKYRQQLMFYKLLVEHSRDYGAYHVERGVLQFVEPTARGGILALEASFTTDELDTFAQLIQRVWQRIVTLDLPDTDSYDPSYKGILQFESELIDNSI